MIKSVSICTRHRIESLNDAFDEWYNHVQEKVSNETGKLKILWYCDIQRDRLIEKRGSDMIKSRNIKNVGMPSRKGQSCTHCYWSVRINSKEGDLLPGATEDPDRYASTLKICPHWNSTHS